MIPVAFGLALDHAGKRPYHPVERVDMRSERNCITITVQLRRSYGDRRRKNNYVAHLHLRGLHDYRRDDEPTGRDAA